MESKEVGGGHKRDTVRDSEVREAGERLQERISVLTPSFSGLSCFLFDFAAVSEG